jgi:hypothetical protein
MPSTMPALAALAALLLATTTTTTSLPELCEPGSHYILDSFTRNVDTMAGDDVLNDVCGSFACCDDAGSPYHPPDWRGEAWYRFSGPAGTRMPDSTPGQDHCGTWSSGWLAGGHPALGEGQVTRTVYFDYHNNPEWQKTTVAVMNCGEFYIYRLPDTPSCYYAYCGH